MDYSFRESIALFVLLASASTIDAFFLPSIRRDHNSRVKTTRLEGLKEWLDEEDEAQTNNNGSTREILLLPFAASEALVPGQSRSLTLKEGRFYDLFQDCIDEHDSMVGMALMGDDGLLSEMPLCVIQDFSVEAGYRGKVTIEVCYRYAG